MTTPMAVQRRSKPSQARARCQYAPGPQQQTGPLSPLTSPKERGDVRGRSVGTSPPIPTPSKDVGSSNGKRKVSQPTVSSPDTVVQHHRGFSDPISGTPELERRNRDVEDGNDDGRTNNFVRRQDHPYRQPFKKKNNDSFGKRSQSLPGVSDSTMPQVTRKGSSTLDDVFPESNGFVDGAHGSVNGQTHATESTLNENWIRDVRLTDSPSQSLQSGSSELMRQLSSHLSTERAPKLVRAPFHFSESSGDVDAASDAPARSISDVSEGVVVIIPPEGSGRISPDLTSSSASSSNNFRSLRIHSTPPASATSTLTRPPLQPLQHSSAAYPRGERARSDDEDSLSNTSVVSDPLTNARGAVGRRSFVRIKDLRVQSYFSDNSVSDDDDDDDDEVDSAWKADRGRSPRPLRTGSWRKGKLFDDQELKELLMSPTHGASLVDRDLKSSQDSRASPTVASPDRPPDRRTTSLPDHSSVRTLRRTVRVPSVSPAASVDDIDGFRKNGRMPERRSRTMPTVTLNEMSPDVLPDSAPPRRKHSVLPDHSFLDSLNAMSSLRPTLTVDGVVVVTGVVSDAESVNQMSRPPSDEDLSSRYSLSSNDSGRFMHQRKVSEKQRSFSASVSLNVPVTASDEEDRKKHHHMTTERMDSLLLPPQATPPSPLVVKKETIGPDRNRSPSPHSLSIPRAATFRTSFPVLTKVPHADMIMMHRRHSSADDASIKAEQQSNRVAGVSKPLLAVAGRPTAAAGVPPMTEEHYSVSPVPNKSGSVTRSNSLRVDANPVQDGTGTEVAARHRREEKDKDSWRAGRRRILGLRIFRPRKPKDMPLDRIESVLSQIDLPRKSHHLMAVYVDSSVVLNWYHVIPCFDSYPLPDWSLPMAAATHHHHHHYLMESRRFDCDKAPCCGMYSYCTDNERRRRQSIWELFRSECVYYVDSLLVLKEIFQPTLEILQSYGFMADVEVDKMFGNLSELCESSDDLCMRILGLFTQHGAGQMGGMDHVARVFDNFAWRVHTPYSLYAANFYKCASYVNAVMQRKDFALYDQFCKKHPRVRKRSLKDFLIEPVTHLPRFILVFKDIEKSMKRDSHPEDMRLLTSTITAISLSCHQTESKFREFELIRIAAELSTAVVWPKFLNIDPRAVIPEGVGMHNNPSLSMEPLDLNYSDTRFLKHFGMLKLYERTPNTAANSRMTTVNTAVFLFNDLLLVTKPAAKAKASRHDSQTQPLQSDVVGAGLLPDIFDYLVYRLPCPVDRLDIHDVPSTGVFTYAFCIFQFNRFEQTTRAYTLEASDQKDKDKWMDMIKKTKQRFS